MMRWQIQSGVWFVFVALAIAFAPYILRLKQFSDDLVQHPQPYLGIAIAMTALGIGCFIVVGILTAFRSGRRMSDKEAQAYASAGLRVPNYAFYRGFFRGKAVGQQVENGSSFRDIRQAFRSGAWRRDLAWRRFLSMLAGALLWVLGAFGIAFILGPPAVKLIVGATLAYSFLRLAWSILDVRESPLARVAFAFAVALVVLAGLLILGAFDAVAGWSVLRNVSGWVGPAAAAGAAGAAAAAAASAGGSGNGTHGGSASGSGATSPGAHGNPGPAPAAGGYTNYQADGSSTRYDPNGQGGLRRTTYDSRPPVAAHWWDFPGPPDGPTRATGRHSEIEAATTEVSAHRPYRDKQ